MNLIVCWLPNVCIIVYVWFWNELNDNHQLCQFDFLFIVLFLKIIQNQAWFKSIHKCTTIRSSIRQQQTSKEKKIHAKPFCLVIFFGLRLCIFLLIKYQKNDYASTNWDIFDGKGSEILLYNAKRNSGKMLLRFFGHHFSTTYRLFYHHHQAHSFYAHTHIDCD